MNSALGSLINQETQYVQCVHMKYQENKMCFNDSRSYIIKCKCLLMISAQGSLIYQEHIVFPIISNEISIEHNVV